MKYVYKNEKGLVILNEEVEILELASIEDLREKINIVDEQVKKHEEYLKKLFNDLDYTTIDSYLKRLKINYFDVFTTKEGTFVLDERKNALIPHEEHQSFDNPFSWTDMERVAFTEVLLAWITEHDLTSELYRYLRNVNTGMEVFTDSDKDTQKLERLFHKELKEGDMLDFYEEHYQRERKEIEEYIEGKKVLNQDEKITVFSSDDRYIN